MGLLGNANFIIGGGSGIGRDRVENFNKSGNGAIVDGARKWRFTKIASTNPVMRWVELDIEEPPASPASSKASDER